MIDAAFLLTSSTGSRSVARVILALCAGRVILAWLPPGLLGRHAWRELPATAAISFFLGLIACVALDALTPAARIAGWCLVVVLALVRIATAPASMVPRHEPPLVRTSWMSRAIVIVAWCVIVSAAVEFAACERAPSTAPTSTALFVASAFSAAFLVDHALDVARCAPWVRATSVLMFALLLRLEPIACDAGPAPCVAFVFTAGAACAVAWLRRGDKRGLATAAWLFAGTWVLDRGAWPLAAAGAAWIVIGSPSPSRWLASAWCGATLVAVLALQPLLPVGAERPLVAVDSSLSGIVAVLFVLIVAARWQDVRLAGARRWNSSGAPRGHEDAVLLRLVITALILAMGVQWFGSGMPASDPIRPALLVLALLSGMALRRFERRVPARTAA